MLAPIEYFETVAASLHFEPGEIIFHQGEWADCMFAVHNGEVRLVQDGVTIEIVGAGGIFGEQALVVDGPRPYSAIAQTAVELTPASEHEFVYLVRSAPSFALQVMRTLASRIRETDYPFLKN